jgi:hypothetical protein
MLGCMMDSIGFCPMGSALLLVGAVGMAASCLRGWMEAMASVTRRTIARWRNR